MVSDAELVERLREVLRSSDLSKTSTAAVRRRLEQDFAVDLSSKKAFIREQVDLFLSTELSLEANDAAEDGAGDLKEEEEEVKEEEEEVEVEVKEAGEGSGGGGEEEDEEDEEEEEEEQEEEGDSSSSRKKRRLDTPSKDGKRRGGGFTKLCSLSPELQKFVGASELARTEVVKKLWEYIRANNMQDPNNKKKIVCDEKFKKLFNVNTIDMFQMNKALTKHIWPLNSEDGPVSPERSKPKDKPQKRDKNEGKSQKGGSSSGSSRSSGFLVPLQLSDDLIHFIGTGESMLSRSDVVKRMWDYIKQNNLQDPSDRRKIICDEKLKDLFKVNTFTGFTVSKLLAPHFVKTK